LVQQDLAVSSDLEQRALKLLRQAVDDPTAEFHQGQWEAIEDLLLRRAKLLVVQRTGWGKSMVYFLTTRLMREQAPERSITLLISPLLALMRDQVRAAERLGVRAVTINSSNYKAWSQIRDQIHSGDVDVLLVSPERLANEDFLQGTLLPMAEKIRLFVVDEAHCISDWGHDFRPDYQRVTRILQALPPTVPVLTTTATANDRVVADVVDQLGQDLRVVRGPLVRKSLRLQNISLPKASSRMAWLARWLPQLPGSGIIYALTIADAQNIAEWLRSRGIEAYAYWGGLDPEEREGLERKLLANQVKALVATTALGMGFDKPDLGFVIHYQRPGSAIHYYQQVGRAGRALDRAYGVLLGGDEDQEITEYFIRTAFPPEAHARQVLDALQASDYGLTRRELEREVNLTGAQIEKTLKSLLVKSPAPASKSGPRWHANPVPYTPDTEKVSRLTSLRRQEQDRMSEYMESRECLMLFLARELDDPAPAPCGRCAVCLGKPLVPETYPRDLVERAVLFLRHAYRNIEPRKQWPADALANLGWRGKISEQLRAEEGRALCLWGDDGWGELVRRGKQTDGRFPERLVHAAAEMVREHWQPEPPPEWVTYVPSSRHPLLVPDFARRIAAALGLPFVDCVRKRASTESQRGMENSYQQAHNLSDAFEVENRRVRSAPVLLVDDMVGSRWTFTVVTAHLRLAGAGKVFPLALAESGKRDS
jgi:ATP-dependent DNA helicase RecQ